MILSKEIKKIYRQESKKYCFLLLIITELFHSVNDRPKTMGTVLLVSTAGTVLLGHGDDTSRTVPMV